MEGGVFMKIPIQICGECDNNKWRLGKCTISGKNEERYNVVFCAKCGNALFFLEDTA